MFPAITYYAHIRDKHQGDTVHRVAVECNLNDICHENIISLIGQEEVIGKGFPEHINHCSSNYMPPPHTDMHVWIHTHARRHQILLTVSYRKRAALRSKAEFCNLCIYLTCCHRAPPCLWSKAGEWLMALESISPPDRMCLHVRLALVLTSRFQRNHRSVCACVCAVVHTQKNLPSSYLDWLKDSELFLFSGWCFLTAPLCTISPPQGPLQ